MHPLLDFKDKIKEHKTHLTLFNNKDVLYNKLPR